MLTENPKALGYPSTQCIIICESTRCSQNVSEAVGSVCATVALKDWLLMICASFTGPSLLLAPRRSR